MKKFLVGFGAGVFFGTAICVVINKLTKKYCNSLECDDDMFDDDFDDDFDDCCDTYCCGECVCHGPVCEDCETMCDSESDESEDKAED